MELDILIPGQETTLACEFISDIAYRLECGYIWAKRTAKEIINSKYWEAYHCGDSTRQEYWRVVLNCLDGITETYYNNWPKP